jgi:ankyrin repeat protein
VVLMGCGSSVPDISIHDGAKAGDIEVIKQHIGAGVNVDLKDEIGFTPLHYVASIGQREIAEYLIEKGANVNAKDIEGATPLHYAASSTIIVQLLLEKGADVNSKNNDGETPLDKLRFRPQYERTSTGDILRKHGGKTRKELEAVEPVAKASDIPIHDAAMLGNIEAVKQHIAAGTDVNALDESGNTPLDWLSGEGEIADLLRKHGGKTSAWLKADESIHIAAEAGHIEAVKKHLAAGVDVNAKTATGTTPLDQASAFNHTEIVDLLRKHGGKYGTIHNAAGGGDIEAVKEFLAAGADVNAKDDGELTPLHLAALEGQKEIVELLISSDADVNAKDDNGWTSLHFAAGNGHKEVAELLISSDADVNAKDDDGETPLYAAASMGQKETTKLLIAEGADVNAKDDDGETSLHDAARWGRKKVAELLIAGGADVNAKYGGFWTPLDAATNPDNPNDTAETADLLRKHGGKTGEELKAEGK